MEDKILARVKKMMAIANDAAATEQERDTALQMAYKVLAKHNLSMVDVHNHEAPENRDEVCATMAMTPWSKDVASSIARLFFCNYLFGGKVNSWKGRHYFIGKESNATTAQLMSEFVIGSILKQSRKLYKDDTSPEARAFSVGAARMLSRRVTELIQAQKTEAEQATPGSALVLMNLYDSEKKDNEAFYMTLHEKAPRIVQDRSKPVTNAEAFQQGESFGKSINLAPQVGTTSSHTKALK
jgi:hypothetical protein